MNSYQSLRKQNSRSASAVVTLALCVVLSATVLFSRLMGFAPADTQHYIPLTRSGGTTTVREGHRQNDGTVIFPSLRQRLDGYQMLAAKPGLKVYDENTVWQSQTKVEIFKISYENGSGQVTVLSENGDKVLAPGTGNTYRFTLENTAGVPVQYTLTMEAWFGDSKDDTDAKIIPVVARVRDYQGNYLAGSASAKTDVLELNKVYQQGTLARAYVAPYTLEWEWPFEVDDVYDTMLGNLAVKEDIKLTIKINVVSSYTPASDGGIPKTGDTSGVQMAMAVMITSGTGLLFLLGLPRRRRRKENG